MEEIIISANDMARQIWFERNLVCLSLQCFVCRFSALFVSFDGRKLDIFFTVKESVSQGNYVFKSKQIARQVIRYTSSHVKYSMVRLCYLVTWKKILNEYKLNKTVFASVL